MNALRIFTAATVAALVLDGSTAYAQGRADGRDQGRGQEQRKPVPQQEQKRRIDEQTKRDADYQQKLNKQVQDAQTRAAALQAQKRNAQAAAQQQYVRGIQQQQQQHQQTQRDYTRDPYYSTPASYRYKLGSSYHQTNEYGANVLRDAVKNGYAQGFEAGRADRSDRHPSNYQQSYAYVDGNYGYTGAYVPETDYTYYFRQGFQRGYQDGYGNSARYGSVSNGTPSILSTILTGILGLQSIR